MSNMINGIVERRSIRDYKEDAVPHDVMELIIKAAVYAPSGKNRQCWHFSVIQNKEAIGRITDGLKSAAKHELAPSHLAEQVCKPEYRAGYGAPVFIIISGDPGFSTTISDCSLAAGNIMLAAHSLGLGSCWINQPLVVCDVPEFRALLTEFGVPQNYAVYACVCIGYPKQPIPHAADRVAGTVNYVE